MKERYGISGIYIFDQFEGEEKPYPTCIEDCSDETRARWLDSLDKEKLIRCCEFLCITIRQLGEQLDIRRES